jgi:hypothetical protein
MTSDIESDFVDEWFVSQESRMLDSGCVVLSAEASDSFHREVLAWSATVWGEWAYYREVIPLIVRGPKEYFGTLRGYSGGITPVLWIDVGRQVNAAIDLSWGRLVQQLSSWDDSLNDRFPPHFHHRDLDNTSFSTDF